MGWIKVIKVHKLSFQERYYGQKSEFVWTLIKPAKSGRNFTYNKILYFYNIDSNKYILSLEYQIHAIQKLKIIYTSRTTTFMKDSKSDKIILKAKIQTQSKGRDWSNEKTNGDEHLTTVKSLT
jgi:hypothetical protein